MTPEDGDDHREPLRIDPGPDAARHGEIRRRHERLHLEQQRPRPLEGAAHRGADLARMRRAEELRRIGHADEPGAVISKTPSSFVEPKRFFVARRTRCSW